MAPCAAAMPSATCRTSAAAAVARPGRDRADRPLQLHRLRDDVVRRPAADPADRDDGRVEDVDPAGHGGLEREDELGRDGDRIEREVRRGRVTAASADRGHDPVARGEQRSGAQRDRARRVAVPDVQGHGAGDLDAVQQPLVEHHAGAVVALLARLEHQQDVAGQLAPGARRAGGPRPAASRRACRARTRASRHRSPRRTRGRCPPAVAGRPCRRGAGSSGRVGAPSMTAVTDDVARPSRGRQPELPKRLGDDGLRLGELEPDLGPAMDPAPDLDHVGEDRLGGRAHVRQQVGPGGHRQSSPRRARRIWSAWSCECSE